MNKIIMKIYNVWTNINVLVYAKQKHQKRKIGHISMSIFWNNIERDKNY